MYFALYWVIFMILDWYFKPYETNGYILVMVFSLTITFIWWMSSVAQKLYDIRESLKKVK